MKMQQTNVDRQPNGSKPGRFSEHRKPITDLRLVRRSPERSRRGEGGSPITLSLCALLLAAGMMAGTAYGGQKATGGDAINKVNIGGKDYWVHMFTNVGTTAFTPSQDLAPEYLVVGGGGAGQKGWWGSGGGGAGGLITSVAGCYSGGGTLGVGSPRNLPARLTASTAYNVTVGNGGTGGGGTGGPGEDSVFAISPEVRAKGGGGGGTGVAGGSGGGSTGGSGAAGTSGQGNAGAGKVSDDAGGGGGGAGRPGQGGSTSGGWGGDGLTNTITGSPVAYAGGGGGGSATLSHGGAGGGGWANSPGTPNTGGGGGGSQDNNNGRNGGSGIVIIRYKDVNTAPVAVGKNITLYMASNTVTVTGQQMDNGSSDADGDPLIFSINGKLSVTYTNGDFGDHVVTFEAWDGTTISSCQQTVTVAQGGGFLASGGDSASIYTNYANTSSQVVYACHQYVSATNALFIPKQALTVEYLVIGGGGGGGSSGWGGGGGGAGGYRCSVQGEKTGGNTSPAEPTTNVTASAVSVTVGAGGAGASSGSGAGTAGGYSLFGNIRSEGGGGGGSAATGGSGGGGGYGGNGGGPGSGTSGQGCNGGNTYDGTPPGDSYGYGGGGGGGASANGNGLVAFAKGKGGDGLASSITGTSVTRAGGGKGGRGSAAGNGASAGGGGGDGSEGGTGTAGQNGIVIVRYAVPSITASDTSHDFSDVIVNATGTWSYTVSGAHLTGDITNTAPSPFTIATNGGTYGSQVVLAQAGGSVPTTTINVHFTPTSVASYSGTITNKSTGADDKLITLTGNGVNPQPVLTVAPTSLNMGNAITNKTSTNFTYTLSGVELTGDVTVSAPAYFTVSTNATGPFGQSCIVNVTPPTLPDTPIYVRFTPSAGPGTYTGSSITNGGGGAANKMVAVAGTGVVQGISVSAVSLAFGDVPKDTTSDLPYTVSGSNLEDDVTVSVPGGTGFTIKTNGGSFGASVTLAVPNKTDPAGGTLSAQTITVRFAPTAGQAYGPTDISAASVGAASKTTTLSGTGLLAAPYLAFGGDVKSIYTNNGVVYGVHSFTNVGSANFTPSQNLKVEYLVVGGGGGGGTSGGTWSSGGGGAGGYRSSVTNELSGSNTVAETPLSLSALTAYFVYVGAGGAAANNGSTSVFHTVVSQGGGRGSTYGVGGGGNGGSGGGASSGGGAGAGTTNQGWAGGGNNGDIGGGGGGAGGAGANGVHPDAGNGGAGLQSSITGSNLWYAGGGGGSHSDGGGTQGTGGSGVGGAGGGVNNGMDGRGGGAGGGPGNGTAGRGGNGIVIVRYAFPSITVSDTSHDFSDVIVNATGTWSYTVSGVSLGGDITIDAPSSEFTIATNGGTYGSQVVLAQSGGSVPTTTINVHFVPTVEQAYSGTITNKSTGAENKLITLTGNGVNPQPVLSVAPTSLNMGNVITNRTSANFTYTLSGVYLTGDVTVNAPAYFAVSTNAAGPFNTLCTVSVPTPTLSDTTIYVQFTPSAGPGTYTGSSITNGGGGAANKMVAVAGTGVVQDIVVSAGSLAFGYVQKDTTSNLTYTVSGTHLGDDVTVSVPGTDFAIKTNGGSFGASVTLAVPNKTDAAGGTLSAQTVTVRFSPTAVQAYGPTVITAASAGAASETTTLTGTGVVQQIGVQQPAGTALTDGSSTIDFGSTVGTVKTFVVTNSGVITLTLSGITKDGNSDDFTVGGTLPASLAVGASTSFTVRFTPAALGARSAGLHIANGAGDGSFDVTLTGTGVADPYLAFGGDVRSIITNNVGTPSQTVYAVHSFATVGSATFSPTRALKNVEFLVVGGGGGGGTGNGGIYGTGGGGAGGLITSVSSCYSGGGMPGTGSAPTSTVSLAAGTPYVVTVGGGGPALTTGGDSVFGNPGAEFARAKGGGAGGYPSGGGQGGSGGGAGYNNTPVGIGTTNQGFNGGPTAGGDVGGGGGGAGNVGGTGVNGNQGGGGQGGPGLTNTITGSSVVYAGGGGGGNGTGPQGGGGIGGGGAAGAGGGGTGGAGTDGRGGGGGGGTSSTGGRGGSGIVIVRYVMSPVLTVVSPYGAAAPDATGIWAYAGGTILTNSITNSPVTLSGNTTQYMCTGFAMAGNAPASGTGTNVTLTLTNNATLTWQWTTNYYLTLATAGVSGGVDRASGFYEINSNVVVTATASNHYHLASWSGDTNGCTFGVNQITVPMSGPRSITANFAIDRHTLTVDAGLGGGAVPGTVTNDYGTQVSQWISNAAPIYGTTQYVSAGWTLSGNADTGGVYSVNATNVTLTLTNNATLTWQWTTNYWLALGTNGEGSVSPSSGFYAAGSNVVVTATAGVAWSFKEWSGDTNGCTINGTSLTTAPLTGPRAITAKFVGYSGTMFKFR